MSDGRRCIAGIVGFVIISAIAAPGRAQGVLESVSGDSANDRLGFAVGSVGDVDGDGAADFVVGAPFDDNTGVDSGSARVISGLSGAVLFTFNGDSAGDRFGSAVASAGDFNNDGTPDVLVGAPFDDNTGADAGSARVLSGATGAMLLTVNGVAAGDLLGSAVAAAGDVDANTIDDFAAAAPGGAYVQLVAGGTGAILFNLTSAAANFARSVAAGRDWNGDGTPDVAVGAGNSVDVLSGATAALLFSANGDAAGDDFGRSLALGDLDGDANADLVVGAPLDDNTATDAGSVRAFAGATGGALYTLDGDSAGDQLGFAVAATLDLDHSGADDLVVGIPMFDAGGADAGGVRSYSGAAGITLYTVAGGAAGDHLGFAVAGAGLVNADVLGDFIAGAPDADPNGADSGRASLYTGYCSSVVEYGVGCPGGGVVIPDVQFTGCLAPGTSAALEYSNGVPNGLVVVLISFTQTNIPLGAGCFLLVGPAPLITLALPLDAAGGVNAPLLLPDPGPMTPVPPVKIYVQVLGADISSPTGFNSTRAKCLCIG